MRAIEYGTGYKVRNRQTKKKKHAITAEQEKNTTMIKRYLEKGDLSTIENITVI